MTGPVPFLGDRGGPTPVDEAMRRIVNTIEQMPYRGMVTHADEPSSVDDPETFIGMMADWLANYRAVVVDISAQHQRTATALGRLEGQRDAVRRFFGTAEIGAETSIASSERD